MCWMISSSDTVFSKILFSWKIHWSWEMLEFVKSISWKKTKTKKRRTRLLASMSPGWSPRMLLCAWPSHWVQSLWATDDQRENYRKFAKKTSNETTAESVKRVLLLGYNFDQLFIICCLEIQWILTGRGWSNKNKTNVFFNSESPGIIAHFSERAAEISGLYRGISIF